MPDEKEPTQRTEQGYEIPVLKRKASDRLLRKIARPERGDGEKRSWRPPASE